MQQSDERPAWAAVPFESIGPLRFGMTSQEVAAALGETATVGQPVPGMPPTPTTEETFDAAAVQAEYDAEGRLIAAEVSDRPVTYQDVRLSGRLAEEVRADLERAGVGSTSSDGVEGFDVPELGLMLYVPTVSDWAPPGTVEAVMVTRRDYREVVGL